MGSTVAFNAKKRKIFPIDPFQIALFGLYKNNNISSKAKKEKLERSLVAPRAHK